MLTHPYGNGHSSTEIKVRYFLWELYEGQSRRSAWFRYGLLLFDVATIVFLVLTSFIDGSPVLELVDVVIGVIILADFIARLLVSRHRFHDLLHPLGLADRCQHS
jgi:voltage-gated potassium channel